MAAATHVDGRSSDGTPQHFLVEEILAMNEREFNDFVDLDIHGEGVDRTTREPVVMDPHYAAALRSPQVFDKWVQELIKMKQRTELTVAAKHCDARVARVKLEEQGQYDESLKVLADFLDWKANALRFLTGVEMRLAEARLLRGKYQDDDSEVRRLRVAILEHRARTGVHDGHPPSRANQKLWAALGDTTE